MGEAARLGVNGRKESPPLNSIEAAGVATAATSTMRSESLLQRYDAVTCSNDARFALEANLLAAVATRRAVAGPPTVPRPRSVDSALFLLSSSTRNTRFWFSFNTNPLTWRSKQSGHHA